MKIERFEEVVAWQYAKELTISVYAEFKNCIDRSFNNQIQRAVVSVMNNIAEGFERSSDKELKYFLFVAKGSCGEVRSMLAVAAELGYITYDQQQKLIQRALATSQLISGFIRSIRVPT